MSDFLQMINSNSLYLAIPIILCIIFIIFYARRTKGDKVRKVDLHSEPSEQEESSPGEKILLESETREVNALVHDVKNRTFGLRYVKLLLGKEYGRQWHYLNNFVYWLYLGMDGKLVPVIPTETLEHSPSELYEALETKNDIKVVLGPQDKLLDKVRMGLMILGACVALFLMYLAAKGD